MKIASIVGSYLNQRTIFIFHNLYCNIYLGLTPLKDFQAPTTLSSKVDPAKKIILKRP